MKLKSWAVILIVLAVVGVLSLVRGGCGLLGVTLGIGAGAQNQRFNPAAFGQGGDGPGLSASTFTSYGLSLDVSWEVDLWGRLRAGARAAVAEAQAALRALPEGAREETVEEKVRLALSSLAKL